MTIGIYKITNKINNKTYIGQSQNIEQRKNQHYTQLKNNSHTNNHLQSSFNYYGERVFTFEIIYKCKTYNSRQMDLLEQLYIHKYDSYRKGYNLTQGGCFYGGLGHPLHNPVTREKQAETQALNKNSTGYYRVSTTKRKDSRTGNFYTYKYRKNGKVHLIQSISLYDLEEKVKSKGLKWEILNQEKAQETLGVNDELLKKYKPNKFKRYASRNKTGFYRVSKKYDNGYVYWQYTYYVDGKQKRISRKSIFDLEDVVLSEGLIWQIVDEDNAFNSLRENNY